MNGTRLTVSVLTPAATVVAREVDEVIAPGVAGEFGVLPGHVLFLSALKAGVLTVRDGGQRQIYAVGPGFLEVAPGGRTQVLVQQAVAAGDVDVEDARAQKAAAEDQLGRAAAGTGEPGPPGTAGQAQANLEWAQAQLDAHAAADVAVQPGLREGDAHGHGPRAQAQRPPAGEAARDRHAARRGLVAPEGGVRALPAPEEQRRARQLADGNVRQIHQHRASYTWK